MNSSGFGSRRGRVFLARTRWGAMLNVTWMPTTRNYSGQLYPCAPPHAFYISSLHSFGADKPQFPSGPKRRRPWQHLSFHIHLILSWLGSNISLYFRVSGQPQPTSTLVVNITLVMLLEHTHVLPYHYSSLSHSINLCNCEPDSGRNSFYLFCY